MGPIFLGRAIDLNVSSTILWSLFKILTPSLLSIPITAISSCGLSIALHSLVRAISFLRLCGRYLFNLCISDNIIYSINHLDDTLILELESFLMVMGGSAILSLLFVTLINITLTSLSIITSLMVNIELLGLDLTLFLIVIDILRYVLLVFLILFSIYFFF